MCAGSLETFDRGKGEGTNDPQNRAILITLLPHLESDAVSLNNPEAGGGEEFYDDIFGIRLDPDLVRIARADELAVFRQKGLWTKVLIQECWQNI